MMREEMEQQGLPESLPENSKQGRRGCLWAVVVVQSIALMLIVVIAIISAMVSSIISGAKPGKLGMGADQNPVLKEVWSWGSGDAKVVAVPISGFISLSREEGMFGEPAGSSVTALLSIRRATHDKDVKAIILNINSGGGGITASDIIYRSLLAFKAAQPGRKVISVYGDVSASGAYYISLASDYIISHPTAITGSIGVIMQGMNIKGLSEKIGIKDVTIKSGKNKDLLNPFHDVPAEQIAMLQVIIDEMHTQFVTIVADERNIPIENVRDLADGRIFTASQAVELGLVDNVGYWEDAVAKAAELLQVSDVKIYRYEQEFSLSSLFKSSQSWDPATALLRKSTQTRFLYLWRL